MNEPVWIEKEVCLAFHDALLARFGGLSGIRDEGLLDSALNRPLHLFHYGKPSLFELAASYAEGIVKNHPFLDGNKRSGLMAAALFIESNGYVCFRPPKRKRSCKRSRLPRMPSVRVSFPNGLPSPAFPSPDLAGLRAAAR